MRRVFFALLLSGAAIFAQTGSFPPASSGGGGAPTGSAGGDLSGTYPNPGVAKINGTTVPTNSTANQVPLTTAAAVTAWTGIPACLDSAGQHLNFDTGAHAFSCGTTGGAPSGSAGGDLAGSTYPNPVLAKISGLTGNVTINNVAVPAAPSAALAGAGAGNLPDIQLSYVQTWLTASGESAPSALSNNVTVSDHSVNGKMTVTLDTTGPAGSTGKNLYRSVVAAAVNGSGCPGNGIDNCDWKKVNSSPIAVATASFTDNVADGSLGTVVPGYDSTAGVITDTFGQILARDDSGNNYAHSTVFLSPGYDNEGRFWFGATPVVPISASAIIAGGGADGGMFFSAVGKGGSATEYHYLAFGADTTHPLIGITACDTDLNGCGSPGAGSATPVTIYAINSDFGQDQFRIDSTGSVGNSDVAYSLGLNEGGTPLGIMEAANFSSSVEKPNFLARKASGQTMDLWQGRESDGTTHTPFHVLVSGYAAQALHTPASSSEACTTGQVVWDAGFFYECVSTNSWKRAALSSF